MIAAIDPGKTGAIALLYPCGFLDIHDMPVIDKEINARAIADLFDEFTPTHIFIEGPLNSHGMGRQSAFNFGMGIGAIKGVIAAMEIPWTPISPARWKKTFNLNRDKGASRATATRLFPKFAHYFKRVKDDGRAEAALIALWGEQNGTGGRAE
jgi:crossover junction endodeoxyribonuclease RuvC